MADMAQIEQRLSSVEAGLSQIQRKLGQGPSRTNWVGAKPKTRKRRLSADK